MTYIKKEKKCIQVTDLNKTRSTHGDCLFNWFSFLLFLFCFVCLFVFFFFCIYRLLINLTCCSDEINQICIV